MSKTQNEQNAIDFYCWRTTTYKENKEKKLNSSVALFIGLICEANEITEFVFSVLYVTAAC